jgi:hypothetical protein
MTKMTLIINGWTTHVPNTITMCSSAKLWMIDNDDRNQKQETDHVSRLLSLLAVNGSFTPVNELRTCTPLLSPLLLFLLLLFVVPPLLAAAAVDVVAVVVSVLVLC